MTVFDLQAGVQATRVALYEGKLLAQRRGGADRCVYRSGTFRCAVGAMFSEHQLDRLDALDYNGGCSAGSALHELKIPLPVWQVALLNRLQQIHDKWAKREKWGRSTPSLGDSRLDLPHDRLCTRDVFIEALDAVEQLLNQEAEND